MLGSQQCAGFSLVGEWRLLSSCSTWLACGDFSCCVSHGLQALQAPTVAARGPVAAPLGSVETGAQQGWGTGLRGDLTQGRGIFLDQGSLWVSCNGRFLSTESPGSPI